MQHVASKRTCIYITHRRITPQPLYRTDPPHAVQASEKLSFMVTPLWGVGPPAGQSFFCGLGLQRTVLAGLTGLNAPLTGVHPAPSGDNTSEALLLLHSRTTSSRCGSTGVPPVVNAAGCCASVAGGSCFTGQSPEADGRGGSTLGLRLKRGLGTVGLSPLLLLPPEASMALLFRLSRLSLSLVLALAGTRGVVPAEAGVDG